jgi:hypothetical protein
MICDNREMATFATHSAARAQYPPLVAAAGGALIAMPSLLFFEFPFDDGERSRSLVCCRSRP